MLQTLIAGFIALIVSASGAIGRIPAPLCGCFTSPRTPTCRGDGSGRQPVPLSLAFVMRRRYGQRPGQLRKRLFDGATPIGRDALARLRSLAGESGYRLEKGPVSGTRPRCSAASLCFLTRTQSATARDISSGPRNDFIARIS